MASITIIPASTFHISLTSFTDFLLKSGSPKLTAAKRIVEQYEQEYRVFTDYYRKFREGVQEMHRRGCGIGFLDAVVDGVTEASKQVNYELLCRGYKRFWASTFQEQETRWITPPKQNWEFDDLAVRVNPELAFESNGETHFIKLYFKDERPSKQQSALILHLMRLALRPVRRKAIVALLDVRRSKLIEPTGYDAGLTTLLEGEALCFQRIVRQMMRGDQRDDAEATDF